MSRPRTVAGRKAVSRGQLEAVGATVRQVGDDVRALRGVTTNQYNALPRPSAWASVPFGPNTPLTPSPINPTRGDGRTDPRLFDYDTSWNLLGDRRLLSWKLLRDAADRISLFRRCIEIRKGHMTGLDWDIVIGQGAVESAQRAAPELGRHKVEAQMRDRLGPQIDAAVEFWTTPDPDRGLEFAAWLSMLLEEVLVLDALPVFPRRTFGGDLLGLEVIDGSTIKPLLDERGGRPLPPFPAYQQMLKGFPRGEFTADTTTDDTGRAVVPNGYLADQLVYRRRVVRSWTPYGYSPVEQALDDGDLYLKRRGWMRSEYADGGSVHNLFELPETFPWTPEQLRDYERDYNDTYVGNTAARLGLSRFLPPGVKPSTRPGDGVVDRYKPDYDLHLIKLLATHFDTTLPELGFTEAKGLGSEGYHEGQADVQHRKTLPLVRWVQGLLTHLSRIYLGTPPELEFQFLGLDDEDDPAAAELDRAETAAGGSTLNEWRDKRGLPRYAFPEADMAMVVTGRGVVFLDGASALAPPGELIGPAQAPPNVEEGPAPKPAPDAAKAELAAYGRWIRKARPGARPFEFTALTKAAAEQADVDLDRVTFKAGEPGPKVAPGRTWPGWAMDLKAAEEHARRLRSAMTGAVRTRALAEAWTTARKAADPAQVHDAQAWLASHSLQLAPAVRAVLREVYTDGYVIGTRAAAALTYGTGIDWGGWTPGDAEAAAAVLGADGAGAGLATMLDQADVTVSSLAEGRMSALAGVLADGLAAGDDTASIAGALEDLLDDPGWAQMVALTETTRAVSTASLDSYRRNGVEAVEWLTAEDQRVCNVCAGNEEDGPVLVGMGFGSGDPGPPAHPSCRCALAPVIAALSDVET